MGAQDPLGLWDANLDSGGQPIEFGLELVRAPDGSLDAVLINAEERIPVPEVTWDGTTLAIAMPYYESRITARLEGQRLRGSFEKRRGRSETASLARCRAAPGAAFGRGPAGPSHSPGAGPVQFETDATPAVACSRTRRRGACAGPS
jgi:hypothetical protein